MLDLLFLPAALLLALALRAVRRGDHRQHGHLMATATTVVLLRMAIHPRDLSRPHLFMWLGLLAAAGTTLLLGRAALAWREGRSARSGIPRLHRAAGALTLASALLALTAWLMRTR